MTKDRHCTITNGTPATNRRRAAAIRILTATTIHSVATLPIVITNQVATTHHQQILQTWMSTKKDDTQSEIDVNGISQVLFLGVLYPDCEPPIVYRWGEMLSYV